MTNYLRNNFWFVILWHLAYREIHTLHSMVDWGYDLDLNEWHQKFDECSNEKKSQSPIAISETLLINNEKGEEVELHNYETILDGSIIENNGRTITIYVDLKNELQISAPFLPSRYLLQNVHFHWSSDIHGIGSEHRIGNESFSVEAHFVHYKKLEEVNEEVVVVAVFFKVDNTSNEELHKIAEKLKDVSQTNQSLKFDGLNLMKVLPNKRNTIYTYDGSLTTPPCYEVVKWIIFPEPDVISEGDMSEFSKLLKQMKIGTSNVRPPQPLNGRKILSHKILVKSYAFRAEASMVSVSNNLIFLTLQIIFMVIY